MTDTAEHVADAAWVAAQNDAFRRNVCLAIPFAPGDPILMGQLVATRAVHAKGAPFVQARSCPAGWCRNWRPLPSSKLVSLFH